MLGIEGFIFALIRFSAFIFLFPLFTQRGVPIHIKIGLSALIAFIVMPESPVSISQPDLWVLYIFQEIAVGLLLSFIVTLVFAAIYFAGQITDVPLGFGLATIYDQQTGIQLPVFSQFYYRLSILIFLAVDGHLYLFRALAESYRYIPIGGFFSMNLSLEIILFLSQQIFLIGLKIAAPIIGTIFLTDIGLGMITRSVPQINVFVLGFPIKILVGMLVVFIAIPAFVALISSLFGYDGILLEYFMGLIRGT